MPQWLHISLFTLVQIFMFIGLFGMLVPFFPGLVIMWLAALGWGIADGFSTWGIVLFALITVLMLFGGLVDNILMAAGARKGGSAWVTILIALFAGVAGTIVFPPFGGIIAAPLAIFLFEYIRIKDLRKAFKAFAGLTAGWGLSFLAKFAIGVVMMLLWWLWVRVG
jgi:hypothetical protein